MYTETAKISVETTPENASLPDINARMPCENMRNNSCAKCFGTSVVFFCECFRCPRRKACEKLVSPWNFD